MDTDGLIRTALTDRHEQFGAKLAAFGGWAMPLEYTGDEGGTVAEHTAVRTDVGVFDVSHLGTVWVEGDGATATIARTFTNDPSGLGDGQSQYTLCCADDGGILDDCIVYRIAADRWMVVPNASNTATVVARLIAAAADDVQVRDESQVHAIIAVQGPRSFEVLDAVTGTSAAAVPYLNIAQVDLLGGVGYLCRTGYTGEVGAELVVGNAHAVAVFDRLLELGATPAGLGARDTLRLEMGYPLHGNDIDPATNPYEARLGWAVKLDREGFNGRDALVVAKAAGPSRRLFGLLADGRGIPRRGMAVTRDGVAVGTVTSGTFSPTLRTGIALAYLDDPIAPGDRVTVDIRGKALEFDVQRPPFVERDPKGV